MAQDLTWQQLSDAVGVSGAIAFDTDTILINSKLLTGDARTGLTDEGVVEFCYKLLKACNIAQTTINAGLTVGNRLNSFPSPFYGTVADTGDGPYSQVTCQVTAKVFLDTDNPIGPSI